MIDRIYNGVLDLNLKDIMIKAIIFDFNGTMIFDQEILEKSWTLFLKNLIHRKPTDEEFSNYIHGRNIEESIHYFLGDDVENINTLKLEKEKIYRNFCKADKENYKLVDGLPEFLDDLKMKNYVCAIATASGLDNIRFHYENLKLYKWFDWNNIIYNDYSFKGKPSPEIYEKCIQNLNLKKDECIVFEDSISGIIAAKNAGVYKVVAINKNKMLPCEKADYIISDYKNAIKIIE